MYMVLNKNVFSIKKLDKIFTYSKKVESNNLNCCATLIKYFLKRVFATLFVEVVKKPLIPVR